MKPKSDKIGKIREIFARLPEGYEAMSAKGTHECNDTLVLMGNAFYLLSAVVEEIAPTRNAHNRDVLQLLLARAMKNHRSIMLLVAGGCDQDAQAILRNLFETRFTLQYIAAEDTDNRCKRFRMFEKCEQARHFNKYKRPPDGVSNEEKARLREEVDETYSADLQTKAQEGREEFKRVFAVEKPNNWSGMSLAELAAKKGVDSYDLYLKAYSTYCHFTHPSFLSYKDYFYGTFRTPTWMPTFKRAGSCGVLATGEIKRVVEIFLEALGANDEDTKLLLNEVDLNVLVRMKKLGYTSEFIDGIGIPEGTWGVSPKTLAE